MWPYLPFKLKKNPAPLERQDYCDWSKLYFKIQTDLTDTKS